MEALAGAARRWSAAGTAIRARVRRRTSRAVRHSASNIFASSATDPGIAHWTQGMAVLRGRAVYMESAMVGVSGCGGMVERG